MSGRYFKLLVYFFVVFYSSQLYAQSFNFRNISIENGLASSECYDVLQDQSGYIWISTDAGICKYNGKEFKTFTTEQGLPSNTVFEIMEDKYGRLWGACYYGGIFYIYNDKIYTIGANAYLKKKANLTKEIIRKIVLDENLVLHVGTTWSYYIISPQNNYSHVKKYASKEAQSIGYTYMKLFNKEVLYARILTQQSNIISTLNLIEANHQSYKIYPYLMPTGNLASSFVALKLTDEKVIFSLGNTIFIYDFHKIEHFEFEEKIITIYLDRQKNLWIGFYDEGYLMFPGANMHAKPYRGLLGKSVTAFSDDKEGGIWVTTLNEGIFYCPNTNLVLEDTFIGENVVGIDYLDSMLLFCTSDNRIFLQQKDGISQIVQSPQYARSDRVNFNFIQNKFYKTGGIACIFDLKGNISPIIDPERKKPLDLTQISIIQNDIWAFNANKLILIKDKFLAEEYILPSRGFCFYYSIKKQFLIGCIDGLYEFKNKKFTPFHIGGKNQTIRISSITENNNRQLIVSTKNKGIFALVDNHWININASHGLSSNICNHIFVGENDTYYVSTNRGVDIITFDFQLRIHNINISNGLPSNEVNKVIEKNGKVYITTKKGLCYYSSDKIIYNIHPPELAIKSISVSNIPLVDQQIFEYDQNDLYFDCDVQSFQQPTYNKVKYKLSPTDQEYKYSTSFKINYDNLHPGNYTLSIQGINNNGIDGPPTIYRFAIKRPGWQSWWFIVLLILWTVLLIYTFTKARIDYIRKRETEKNDLKAKIVEFHYTALRAQMNPHFIFNVINSIQLYVLKNQPKEAYNYLSKFSKLIRRVLQNSKEKLISLSDELETIQLYMELEQIRLEKGVSFTMYVDPSIDQDLTLVPSMIIQPLLENSIWHGIVPLNGSRKGIIHLQISGINKMMKIVIKDNGVGIIEEVKRTTNQSSFGLSLIRDRLTLLSPDASIEIISLFNKEKTVSGTEVIIIIPIIKKQNI